MKTKLLKKIRKQYSIVYYPARGVYEIEYPHSDLTIHFIESLHEKSCVSSDKTLQGAKDKLMIVVRHIYYKHSRKYKLSQVKHKVWYK